MNPDTPRTTRAAAQAAGHSTDYTGKPCSRGHLSPRYVKSAACVACVAGYARAYKTGAPLPAGFHVLQLTIHDADAPAVRDLADTLTRRRIVAPVMP